MKILNKHITIPLVTMMVLIIIGMLSYTGLRMSERNTPLVDASMEIKYELTLFHLWFEELIQGDTTLTEADVWQHLEQSQWYANAMLNGGQNTEGTFLPLDDPQLRKLITSTLTTIEMLKQTGIQRLQKNKVSQAGSDIDTKFDNQFRLAINSADKVETGLQKFVAVQLNQYRILSLTLAIAVILLGFIILFFAKKYDKNRNQLLSQLSDSNKNLKSQVEEQTHHLREALKHAESGSQAKSVFLSSMSHELRTPLNSILGFSQVLELEKDTLSENQNSAVQDILAGGHHLLHLVNEVLDLAQIESGKMDCDIEEIHLKEIIEQCSILIDKLAGQSNIQINYGNPENHIIMADPQRMKQVLLNYLSNAIKYNRPNGQVTISYQTVENNRLRINVTDTGRGINESDLAMLFQRFTRVGDKSTNIEGTGIGLVISKELMTLMDGIVGVSSVVGEGTTFWCEIKLGE